MRKPCGLRSVAICDADRFDQVVFDLLSRREFDDPIESTETQKTAM
jgi:hypothetical protein